MRDAKVEKKAGTFKGRVLKKLAVGNHGQRSTVSGQRSGVNDQRSGVSGQGSTLRRSVPSVENEAARAQSQAPEEQFFAAVY